MTAAEMLVALGVDPEIADQAVVRWAEHAQIDMTEFLAMHMAADSITAICFGCGSFWTGRVPTWATHQPQCYSCIPWACEGSTVEETRTSDLDGTRVRFPTGPQLPGVA